MLVLLVGQPAAGKSYAMAHLTHRRGSEPESRRWLAHYRRLLDDLHQHRHIDPRALPAYQRLHADATAIADMAFPAPGHSDRAEHDRRHHDDGLLLHRLADIAQPPAAARAFPPPSVTADPLPDLPAPRPARDAPSRRR